MNFDEFVASKNQAPADASAPPAAQPEAPPPEQPAPAAAPLSFDQFVQNKQAEKQKIVEAKTDQRVGSSLDNPVGQVMSYLAGAADMAADTTLGIAKSGANLVGAKDTANYLGKKQADVEEFQKGLESGPNPMSAKAGHLSMGAAEIIASSPMKAGLGTIGGVSGGLSAFSESKSNSALGVAEDTLEGAGKGFATGYGLSKGGKLIAATGNVVDKGIMHIPGVKNVIDGFAVAMKDASDYAEAVTKTTLAKVSGKFSEATADDFVNSANEVNRGIERVKNQKYAARDAEAINLGAKVSKSNLSTWLSDTTKGMEEGFTASTNSATKFVKNMVGKGQDIPYAKAQEFMSDIGSAANKAKRAGDFKLEAKLLSARDALEADITAGAEKAGGKLKELHEDASKFFKETYLPTREEGMAEAIKDKFTSESYLSNFAKRVLSNPQAQKALGVMGDDAKKIFIAAHLNSLKKAAADSTDPTKINIVKYAQDLNNDLKKYPELYGSALKDVETFAKAISARASAGKGITQHSLGQAAGMSALGSVALGPAGAAGVAGTYLVRKAHFLHSAGKMLNSEEARRLAGIAQKMDKNADPQIVQMVYDKLNKIASTAVKGLAALEGKDAASN